MEELNLSELKEGHIIHVLAGEGSNTNTYSFNVKEPGAQPVCLFIHQPAYDADLVLGPLKVRLEGCICKEDTAEEEVEDELLSIQPGDGTLKIGGVMAVMDTREHSVAKPGVRRRLFPPIAKISLGLPLVD